MSGEQHNNLLERRVCLPKPDVNNITVLTQSLPNDPILPWHHYDSPWLEKTDQEEGSPAVDEEAVIGETAAVAEEEDLSDGGEQLSLLSSQATSELADLEALHGGEAVESREPA